MTHRVLVFDNDIRMAIFFLTNLATILRFMQLNILKMGESIQNIDLEIYKEKMNNYEEVFDAVIEDFNNSMFGYYSNSVSRKNF